MELTVRPWMIEAAILNEACEEALDQIEIGMPIQNVRFESLDWFDRNFPIASRRASAILTAVLALHNRITSREFSPDQYPSVTGIPFLAAFADSGWGFGKGNGCGEGHGYGFTAAFGYGNRPTDRFGNGEADVIGYSECGIGIGCGAAYGYNPEQSLNDGGGSGAEFICQWGLLDFPIDEETIELI